jgi:hypothetical protein
MPRSITAFAVAIALAASSLTATAQLRRIPEGAKHGEFTAGQLPAVRIDGKDYRLAPGARILNANNATITPNLVPPKSFVSYQLDGQGQVRTVWVLTAEEARARR